MKPEKQDLNLLQDTTVLLAEDDLVNAQLTIQLLSKWNVQIDHVLNGIEAVEQAKQKKYDFILMDVHMPELNGIAAANIIREENNPNHDVPIFALTADIMINNDDDYLPLFNEFLFKPLEVQKLNSALVKASQISS